MQTIQQERAKQALQRVRKVIEELQPNERKEYRSHTQSLPFMIHANGLGQAYSFYLANCGGEGDKAKKSYQAICRTLAEWLLKEGQPYAKKGLGTEQKEYGKRLLEAITEEDMHTYLLAQAEAVAYMGWVKRFAEAFINDK